jgi:hypothetical protein
MRTTLKVLHEFEENVCTFEILPKRDKVIFHAREAPAVGELHLTKQEALNLLNEMIDLINEEPSTEEVDVEHYIWWLIKNELESEWLIKQILLAVANKNGCRHYLDMLEEIGMQIEGRRIPEYDLPTIILTLRDNNCFVEYRDFILKELFYSKHKENYE